MWYGGIAFSVIGLFSTFQNWISYLFRPTLFPKRSLNVTIPCGISIKIYSRTNLRLFASTEHRTLNALV